MENVVASDDRVLKIEQRLKAAPEKVFAAWTDPKQVAKWFSPEGMSVAETSNDARPGGKWATTMRSAEGTDHLVSGVYREVERPRRLVFTWAWHNEGKRGHETEVVVEFRPDAGGTLMTLLQRPFQDQKSRDMHNMGWSSSLGRLQRLVAA